MTPAHALVREQGEHRHCLPSRVGVFVAPTPFIVSPGIDVLGAGLALV